MDMIIPIQMLFVYFLELPLNPTLPFNSLWPVATFVWSVIGSKNTSINSLTIQCAWNAQ